MYLSKGDERFVIPCCGILLIIVICIRYISPILFPWSFDCACYATVFLLVGNQFKKKEIVDRVYQKPFIILVILISFIALSYLNGSVHMSVAIY